MTSTTGQPAPVATNVIAAGRRDRRRLYPAVAAIVALGICLWRIGTPTYWRDESVSVVVGRSGAAASGSSRTVSTPSTRSTTCWSLS
ncbi:hypothetical protein ACQPZ8_32390 [Actinomadura nitritigenes]|uniref:hypothetical protein n=1 Tax=Actinomadura nitritigenes TaxID=134602 RepID=UPI003D94F680